MKNSRARLCIAVMRGIRDPIVRVRLAAKALKCHQRVTTPVGKVLLLDYMFRQTKHFIHPWLTNYWHTRFS